MRIGQDKKLADWLAGQKRTEPDLDKMNRFGNVAGWLAGWLRWLGLLAGWLVG